MRGISWLAPLKRLKEVMAGEGRLPGTPGQQRFDEALASFDQAIALQPDFAQAFNNRGIALKNLQRFEEAVASFDRPIALQPNLAQAFNSRGGALHEMGRFDEALASFDQAIALKPDFAQAFSNRGLTLKLLRRLEEAVANFDRAIALKPDFAQALSKRGNALREMHRLDEALRSFDQAIALKPDFASAIKNRGMTLLFMGRLRQGWADYEWRWKETEGGKRPKLAAPVWRGENLEGRRIVVFSEQGLGDIIQFVRYLPLLVRRGADVTCLVTPKLARLLRPLEQRIAIAASVDGPQVFDFQCAMMSLPDRFGTELSSIPASVPYLFPEDRLICDWRGRLGAQGFKVGINWQGSPERKLDRGRAIPPGAFAPLAQIEGVRLISLQKNHGSDRPVDAPVGLAVETLGGTFDSGPDAFVDTAAVMANLDLIITSDTSVAHLAGALGRPVWVGLKHDPDWRWMLERSDSPWYPTMRLFRQQSPGDWNSVLQGMTSELSAIVGAGKEAHSAGTRDRSLE